MKRYLVFAGDNYYPAGGWRDFRESFDNLEEAKTFLYREKLDWGHILDTKHEEIVFKKLNL